MPESEEAQRDVTAALRADARTAPFHDRIRVCQGREGLELRGQVDDLAMYRRAERVARSAIGDKALTNAIQLEPYPARQDGEITDHVRDALTQDSALQQAHIGVSVQQGQVRLEGRADSQITKRLAEATAWWVPGVRGVENRLEVDHPEMDRDWIVLESLQVIFSKDWLLSGSNIRFSFKDGTVKLTGVVPGPEVLQAAENDVWTIEGVEEVINELQVMPEAYPAVA